MKKIQFIIVTAILSIVGMTSAKAQNYLLDYGPGSIPWCMQMQQRINAISMQNAMMRAQTMAFYQQQAAAATQHLMNNPFQPMPGIVTYDGVYITPDTVNDYHKEQVDCEHCDGGIGGIDGQQVGLYLGDQPDHNGKTGDDCDDLMQRGHSFPIHNKFPFFYFYFNSF